MGVPRQGVHFIACGKNSQNRPKIGRIHEKSLKIGVKDDQAEG
jgi:hypothetical protein